MNKLYYIIILLFFLILNCNEEDNKRLDQMSKEELIEEYNKLKQSPTNEMDIKKFEKMYLEINSYSSKRANKELSFLTQDKYRKLDNKEKIRLYNLNAEQTGNRYHEYWMTDVLAEEGEKIIPLLMKTIGKTNNMAIIELYCNVLEEIHKQNIVNLNNQIQLKQLLKKKIEQELKKEKMTLNYYNIKKLIYFIDGNKLVNYEDINNEFNILKKKISE